MIQGPVAVTANAFSQNKILRKELCDQVRDVKFNETKKRILKDRLPDFLKDCQFAIVSLDQIDADLIGQLKNLKKIVKFGVGVENIDVEALRKKDIALSVTPGLNARSVSEMVLCFMLGLQRSVFSNAAGLKKGVWSKNGGRQLSHKTIGIVGLGHVGRDLISLLQPFQCRILVYDIAYDESFLKQYANIEKVNLPSLLKQSDLVSIHAPARKETYHLIGAKELSLMNSHASLINTARGSLVDTKALKEALKCGKINAAALDVFEQEPILDDELLSLPNLVATSHIGGNSEEAILAAGRAAIAHINQGNQVCR